MAEAARHGAVDVGSVLAETYEVTRLLGKGGMGAVWEARHLRLEGKKVAVKVLHPDVAGDADAVTRFRREAQIASRLGHPNIVQVHDFNTLADGTAYLILELLDGESLAERLARGPLPLQHVMAIVRQIGSALHAAHAEDIIHRDLKPHNVFLCPTEAGGFVSEQVKVLDFGISKIRGSKTVETQTTAILGTPQYMAPEQALGDHAAVDARTDVFALGAMLYEMLAGQPPFTGQTIPEVMFKVVYGDPPDLGEQVPSLPRPVVDAVHRALAKKQEDRFDDVSGLIEALTGAPLATLRGNAAAPVAPGLSASVSSRVQSDDALAATVAPVSQAAASPEALAATVAPVSQAAASPKALAATVAPAAQATAPAAVAAAQLISPAAHPRDTAHAPDAAPEPAPPGGARIARRALLPYIFGLGSLLVAASALLLVVLRDGPAAPKLAAAPEAARAGSAGPGARGLIQPPPEPPVQRATTAGQAGADPDEDRPPSTGAAGQDPAPPKPAPPEPAPPEPAPPKPAPPKQPSTAPIEEPLPAEVHSELKQVDALLDQGNVETAIRRARHILGKERTPRAYALLTRAYCVKRDLGNARANFQHVRGPLRARILRFCARYDIDLR